MRAATPCAAMAQDDDGATKLTSSSTGPRPCSVLWKEQNTSPRQSGGGLRSQPNRPPGRRVPPPDRRVPPPDRRVPPPDRRVPPPGRRVPPLGRRVQPPSRRVPLPRRRVPPLPSRRYHHRVGGYHHHRVGPAPLLAQHECHKGAMRVQVSAKTWRQEGVVGTRTCSPRM